MKIFTHKKHPPLSVNMLWLDAVFSIFYWIMESVRDVIVFEKGNILGRIFYPDPMSFWMRMLVIFIFVLFSIYSNSLREKIEFQKTKMPRGAESYGIILAGLGFGLLYWFLEAFRDVFVFQRGDFWHRLVMPEPMGFWMRSLVIFILILFSVYAQNLINQRRRVEKELRNAQEDMEKMIGARTSELTFTNAKLIQQIAEREKAETGLKRANRALKTLSACNEAMIRAGDENKLLKKTCQTLADMGGYPLVWVSSIDQNGGTDMHPVTECGIRSENSNLAKLTTKGFRDEWNPVGRAVRLGSPSIMKHFSAGETASQSWTAEASKSGFRALLSLPLKSGGQVFGALSIFASDSNSFDMEELGLLEKLADNLAFGIGVLRTRTQRDSAVEEKGKMQAQLFQSHKMEAVGILAGGVAHDFNNLLTAIQVSADLAMLEVGESNAVYKTLREIHSVSTHAADLARSLLMFSRKHPMEYVSLNLNNTVQNLNKMLKRLIGEDVQIETQTDPDLWIVSADRGTMEQVIMNLAVNARDAMPKGGKLFIRTENAVLDKSAASKMPDARAGRFVRISVSDTGVGMTRDVLEHMYEPFFSTKGIGKGTGLGLSVVYGIVKQHEGWIYAESESGKGTSFRIYLPAALNESKADQVPESVCGAYWGRGERILIVEDEERVMRFAEKGLAQSGYTVFQAATAEQARSLFDREGGNMDLVFTDVVLPDRSGVELGEDLRAHKPGLKILFTSGYTDQKSQWSLIQSRGFHFFPKPYGLTDLLRMVRNTLDGVKVEKLTAEKSAQDRSEKPVLRKSMKLKKP